MTTKRSIRPRPLNPLRQIVHELKQENLQQERQIKELQKELNHCKKYRKAATRRSSLFGQNEVRGPHQNPLFQNRNKLASKIATTVNRLKMHRGSMNNRLRSMNNNQYRKSRKTSVNKKY